MSIWHPILLGVDLVINHKNSITMNGIWKPHDVKCGFINVYAPQDHQCKVDLWKEIANLIGANNDRSWLCCRPRSVFCPAANRQMTRGP